MYNGLCRALTSGAERLFWGRSILHLSCRTFNGSQRGGDNASLSIKVPPGKGSAVCRGGWGGDSPAPEGPVQKSQLVVTPTFYPC